MKSASDIKKNLKKSNGYKKLSERHKRFIRQYVVHVLTNKKTIYEVYMDVYEWDPSKIKYERKRKEANVLANKIMNTPGAQDYKEELQKKINDEIEHHEVIRPITEDLKLLDKIIMHNVEGLEHDKKTLYSTTKGYLAIAAIKAKGTILGENRIRVLSENDQVDMSEEAVESRLNTLIKKGKGK